MELRLGEGQGFGGLGLEGDGVEGLGLERR